MKPVSTPYHLCLEILGNPLRIEIIKLLGESPASVGELAKQLGEEQSKVSHSLAVLRKCNFVESEREGKRIVYKLRKTLLQKMHGENLFEALDKHAKEHSGKCWRC